MQEKQILRQSRFPMQKFSGSGVFQSQQVSVEGLPVQGCQGRLALEHPKTGEVLHWESALPEDLLLLQNALRAAL